MKKLILAAIFVMLMISTSYATDLIKLNSLNLQGDTLYLLNSGSFAAGAGSNIATIKDIVELRVDVATPVNTDGDTMAGIGAGVNIVKLINKLGGTWLVNSVNASIGFTELANFNGKVELESAIYLSIINVGR